MTGGPANPLKNVLLWLVTIWIVAMVVQVLAVEFVYQLERLAPWLLLTGCIGLVAVGVVRWLRSGY